MNGGPDKVNFCEESHQDQLGALACSNCNPDVFHDQSVKKSDNMVAFSNICLSFLHLLSKVIIKFMRVSLAGR